MHLFKILELRQEDKTARLPSASSFYQVYLKSILLLLYYFSAITLIFYLFTMRLQLSLQCLNGSRQKYLLLRYLLFI